MGKVTHGLCKNYKTDKEARVAYEKYRRSTAEHKKWSEEYRKKKKEEIAEKKKIYHQSVSYKRINEIRNLKKQNIKLKSKLKQEKLEIEILKKQLALLELKNVK